MSDQSEHTQKVRKRAYGVRVFHGHQGLADIKAEWRTFDAKTSTHKSFFQSASWCLNWLKCHRNTEPVIVTAWKHGKLAMLLPLMQSNSFGVRILEIMTDADAYYAGPISAKDTDIATAFQAMLVALKETKKFDLLRLNSVPEELPICTLARKAHCLASGLEYSSIIELSDFRDLDEYLATRSKGSRKSLRRKVKDFEKLGSVEAKTVHVSADYKEKMFPTICKWKREWFFENGVLGGNFNRSDMEEQLAALCDTENAATPALATELRLDGKLVACDVMLQRDGILYSYVTARDLAYDKYGIGTVMDTHTIKYAIENGYKALDLLSAPNPSKVSLSTKQVQLVDLLFPFSLRGRLQAKIDRFRIRNIAKNLFYKLPVSLRRFVISFRNRR